MGKFSQNLHLHLLLRRVDVIFPNSKFRNNKIIQNFTKKSNFVTFFWVLGGMDSLYDPIHRVWEPISIFMNFKLFKFKILKHAFCFIFWVVLTKDLKSLINYYCFVFNTITILIWVDIYKDFVFFEILRCGLFRDLGFVCVGQWEIHNSQICKSCSLINYSHLTKTWNLQVLFIN